LIAFVLFEAAFYCEIIRAGIGSIRSGQTEAALATGMRRWQALRLVVLPQALRAMTPLLLNQIIIVFQDTSLVYVVRAARLHDDASVVGSRDGRPTEMYTLVAVSISIICFSLSKAVELRLEGADMIVISDVTSAMGRTPCCAAAARPFSAARSSSMCGPSGSGKSTLIKCVNGLVPFDQRNDHVDGVSVADKRTDLPACARGSAWCSRISSSIRT
jgi:hypothetical protein